MIGNVVRFPRRRHARTSSAGCRAAKPVSTSAVTRLMVAVSVARTADHHSAGTLSRCHHFETADGLAPMSAAMASREGQRSMMDLNDSKLLMISPIGQTVLQSKANPSLDLKLSLGHNVPMTKRVLTDFEMRFLARTFAARKLVSDSQADFAAQLEEGMEQDHYKQFEVRSKLPHELIDQFLSLTKVSYEWLFTGRGKGPAWQARYEELVARQAKKTRKGRAA